MTEQRVLQPSGRMPGWGTVNTDPAERLTRITVGAGVVIVGLLGLITTGSVLATALGGLFVLIGLHLVITGALGHCPLYAELGHTRRS